MPNRVIREGVLDSERYWSVSIEARELYRHLQLIADDFGCLSLAPMLLRRRCFDPKQPPSNERIDALIAELAAQSADLIRPYEANGARYAFIPRFRQRLKRSKLKHPLPPTDLWITDDAEPKFRAAIEKNSNEISEEYINRAALRQPEGRPMAATRPPTITRREENPEEKRIQKKTYTVIKDNRESYPQVPKTLIDQIRQLPVSQQAEAIAEYQRRAAANPNPEPVAITEPLADTNPTSTPDEKFKD